jgi:hypothetical protein
MTRPAAGPHVPFTDAVTVKPVAARFDNAYVK